MDLSTTYMGMQLNNPLVASASPLSQQVDNVKRMEDAGLAAVVLFSLFEEELEQDSLLLDHYLDHGTHSFAEALDYFPEHHTYHIGPDAYLDHIRKLKESVDIPIIASLNGTTPGGWVEYARQIEAAGADALELNIYYIPTDILESGQEIEDRYLDILNLIKQTIDIPVAVKLSPFFSAIAHFCSQLENAGADALVLFNRFYQPDFDLEKLEIYPHVLLSTPQSLRLPLRWIAILYGRLDLDMAGSSGVHTAEDVLKMLMAGANVTMMTSALLKRGIDYTSEVLRDMEDWMVEFDYESVKQLQGSMSQRHCADPTAFERANYVKALSTYGKKR